MSAPNLIYPPSTGGGGVSGSGTPNSIPIWSTATSLSDSPLSFSGSTLTYSSALTTHAFAVPQSWTLPANTQAWRINGQQLVFDGGNGYLGINPPTSPAAPLHVEGSVGTSELVRLRNTSTALASPVGIRAHAANRGASTPTGKIENYPISFSPLYGVYDWVYSLPTTNNVMTEVFRQTAPTTILTVTLTSGGSGYTNGTYSQVALTNVSSSGSGATADIVVASGIVTVAVLRSGGSTYDVGDTLTCASIGGGTGFVLTVASVGSRATASGNVTATRIGAGTTTPRGAFDLASGAFYATSQDLISRPSSSAGTFTTIYASVYAGATEQIAKNYPVFTFSAAPRIDQSLQTSGSVAGYGSIPQITGSTAAQAITLYGYQATVYRAQPLDVSTGTTSVYGYYSQCGVVAGLGAASTSSVVGFHCFPYITAVGHTIASFINFQAASPSFNVASTITDYYGFRQLAHSGSGTITNRWGVSIEDVAAKNYFAGTVGIGTASPGFPLDVVGNSRIGTYLLACTDFGEATIVHSSVSAANRTTRYALTTNATGNDTVLNSGNTLYFRILNTEMMRLTSTGNVGIGTTPNAWATSVRATEMRTHALWNYNSGSDSVAYWTVNAYLNSGGTPTYKASTFASQYTQIGGAHVWERAVSGTAGNAVTWLESARIDSSGRLGVGLSPSTYILETATDASIYGVRVGRGAGAGSANTCVGNGALNANTTGNSSVAIGDSALGSATTASGNTAVGSEANRYNTTGGNNTAVGYFSLRGAAGTNTGASNVAVGFQSGKSVTTGSNNLFAGYQAGANATSGNSNIVLGAGADTAAVTDSNQLVLGGATNYVATNGGATTYYATAGASLGYIQVRLNGANVKIEVFAP